MSTELYKEAVIEARKLKQLAQEEAQNEIIKAISPQIKKMISETVSGAPSSFFFETTDEEPPVVDGSEQQQQEEVPPLSGGEEGLELGTLSDQPNEAPVTATGEDIIDVSVPDAEGKITVDINDLFVEPETGTESTEGTSPTTAPLTPSGAAGGEEMQPADTSPPVMQPEEEEEEETQLQPPTMESVGYNKFKGFFSEVSEKIDHVFFKGSIDEPSKKLLENRLLKLLELLDNLKDGDEINKQQLELNENKLEFLFLKLKEASEPNSYLKEGNKKEKIMTSLKKYAAKLFESDRDGPYSERASEGVKNDTTMSAKHAADESGVSTELGGPKDIKASTTATADSVNEEVLAGTAGSVDAEPLPGTNVKPPSTEEQWADGEPALGEENQDKVIDEALDALDEEAIFEVDEKELAEAVRSIQKGNIKKKMKALKETMGEDGPETKETEENWEEADPEGGSDPSHKNLKEAAEDEEMMEDEDDVEDLEATEDVAGVEGMDMEDDVEGMDMEGDVDVMGMEDDEEVGDADLVLNIDLPDEAEEALSAVDAGILDDIGVELGDVNLGDVAAEEEMVAGGEEMPGAVGDEELEIVDDDEEEEPGVEEEPGTEVYESVNRKYKKRALRAESDLREANLFLAKNVYFTKFLQRGDISRKNLGRIVDYLDGAKTVAEAKGIYKKIKVKLNEAGRPSKKLAGSPSRATTSGGVSKTLTESAQRKSDPNDPVVNTSERWQYLAGITKKK